MISTEMDSDMSKSLGINSTKRIVSLMVGDIGVVITLDVKIVSSASIGISYLIPHESRISMIRDSGSLSAAVIVILPDN